MSAQTFKTDNDKENYYSELKAAAESGWDFSSRWFILNGTNKGEQIRGRGSVAGRVLNVFSVSAVRR